MNSTQMMPRERLMAAINHRDLDHIPMSFMIFSALKQRLTRQHGSFDPVRYVEGQIELGLDAFVDLRYFNPDNEITGHSDAPGIPVPLPDSVRTEQYAKIADNHPYPVLHKTYHTTAGKLSVVVNQTDDWPYGDARKGVFHVPLMDDYIAARSDKYLIEKEKDLEPLQQLLLPPDKRTIRESRKNWDQGKKLARKHDLLVAGGWGVGSDALAWFCGLENAVYMALEAPELLREILKIIDHWNRARMTIFLDYGVDLFIRRAWYEGTDFWSPDLFREFFLPIIKKEVRMTHEAGAKYGYIMTSGSMPLHDQLIEAGIDVLIGADPVQGKGTDLERMKADLDGKIAIWGGVNGFISVERGSDEDIESAVKNAIDGIGTQGAILSPVDNIRDPSDVVWDRTLQLIHYWKEYR